MIARQTGVALLLALGMGTGIRIWAEEHRDPCDAYFAGDHTMPDHQMVDAGSRMVAVPCRLWIPRQTLGVQAACLGDLVVWVVFGVSAMGDVRRGFQRRRRSS